MPPKRVRQCSSDSGDERAATSEEEASDGEEGDHDVKAKSRVSKALAVSTAQGRGKKSLGQKPLPIGMKAPLVISSSSLNAPYKASRESKGRAGIKVPCKIQIISATFKS